LDIVVAIEDPRVARSCRSAFLLMSRAERFLCDRGRIVHVVEPEAMTACEGPTVENFSQMASEALVEALAPALAPRGISINSISRLDGPEPLSLSAKLRSFAKPLGPARPDEAIEDQIADVAAFLATQTENNGSGASFLLAHPSLASQSDA
jgi:NAD(P)-dependent dehydrogenase (short-subunit alcohol dehydrogenase family)